MTSEYERPLLSSAEDSSMPAPDFSLEDKHFDISAGKDKKITVNSIHNATRDLLDQESREPKDVLPTGKSQETATAPELDDSKSHKRKRINTPDSEMVANDSQDSQSTGSGADSDVEDNIEAPIVDGPYITKEYDPSIDERLPDTVTILTTPEGGKLYLIGTAHFSVESQDDVSNIIQAVQPNIVMVELCKARVHILQLDEKTILQEAENLTFRAVRDSIQQNGPFNGLLYILLLNMSAHLTKELGMAPGGEFRRAFAEAKKIQNCIVHLGDRPINITLQRALSSLGWWQTFKLGWHLLTSNDPISKEEVERCKRRDMLEEMLADMAGEFPALGEVFVKERDLYLTHSLQLACLPHRTATGWKQSRVVGVVGIGHMRGIVEHWGKVQSSEIVPIMRIPPPTLSSKIIRLTIKASLVGAVIFVGYKIIPLPSGLTMQSIKSSVEGLFKVLECRVCEEVFTVDEMNVPRLLQCGHTVCHSCLLRLQPSVLEPPFLLCPFDRQPTEMQDDGVSALKKNFALIELLERLEQSSSETTMTLKRERLQSTQACDEDESHLAVLYCTVCSTHLCEACDMITHSSKTLGKHRRVPLSEKPKEKPKCPIHSMHIAEFTCIQDGCHNALMCYLCKDYGRHSVHKPALVEIEAESVRKSIVAALQKMTQFMESMRDTAHRIESVIQELEGWAIEDARHRVRQHFDELRTLLGDQEKAAMTCVDTETRGRLCALRQQQKDLTATRSQVAAVCIQCESILDSEDWKLLSGAEKVKNVLASLEQQQQHYAQLGPDYLTPESSIPIIFSRDNRVYIGTKIDMRVVILGLDGAGKTSILSAMRGMTLSGAPIPTIGFNVESLEYKNLMFTLWDVGGQHKFRPLWKHYYHNTQAVIFVVDASDKTRFDEAQKELSKIVNERELKDAWFLIYANKQDVSDCATVEELTDILALQKLCCGRAWHIQGSSPLTDPGGSTQGLDWLTQQLGAHEGLYSVPAAQQQ